MLVLQAFAYDAPGFYADAKLLSLAIALSLMALAGLLAWRVFSPAAGVATVALLALLPTLGEIASGVLADVMYAAVLLACVTAIGATLERGPLAWLGAGADDRPRLPDQGERPPRVPRPRDGRRGGARAAGCSSGRTSTWRRRASSR